MEKPEIVRLFVRRARIDPEEREAGGLLKRAKGAVLLLGEDHDKEGFIFSEKSSKKVLTKSVKRSILTELSARGTKQAADR